MIESVKNMTRYDRKLKNRNEIQDNLIRYLILGHLVICQTGK